LISDPGVGEGRSLAVGDGILLGIGEDALVGVEDGTLVGVGDGTLVGLGDGVLVGVGDSGLATAALLPVSGTTVPAEANSPDNTKTGTRQILKSQFKRFIVYRGGYQSCPDDRLSAECRFPERQNRPIIPSNSCLVTPGCMNDKPWATASKNSHPPELSTASAWRLGGTNQGPNYAYTLQVYTGWMLDRYGLTQILPSVAAPAGCAGLFFVVAIWRFKSE
jgi:hypothetical protein